MKLNINQLKEITTGAVRIIDEKGVFSFKRFTKEQEELYKITNEDFYNKTHSTSGVKFYFKTDSKNLFIKLKTLYSTSRTYFSVDVFVNGQPVGYIDNFSNVELEDMYTVQEFELGEYSKNFALGDGEKTVCVHLPWSVETLIEEISIDDNAYIEGAKPKKKLLAFGDSITHGYDALRPSNRYIAKLADKLGAEELNKAIGGERFFPELANIKGKFNPDYITVAYGTNDWRFVDSETFKIKCRDFYTNLVNNYPGVKIFAITPVWRKDKEDGAFGVFEMVEEYIKEIVAPFENITVVSGYDFVPKEEKYFADFRLHPNDMGFEHYVNNLYDKIKDEI